MEKAVTYDNPPKIGIFMAFPMLQLLVVCRLALGTTVSVLDLIIV